MGLADVRRFLIHNEFFVPLAGVLTLDPHVEKACAHRHQEVDFLIRHFLALVNQAHCFFISDTRLQWVALRQILARLEVDDVHSDEWVHDARV